MIINEVLKKVEMVFKDVLDDENIIVSLSTTADDVPEWDSLNHIELVVEVEKEFKISFTTEEIEGFKNVGEMCESIVRKKNEE